MNWVSEHTTARKMSRNPRYISGVGRSAPNSTEKATPKGASRESSRAAEEGSVSVSYTHLTLPTIGG